MGVPVSRFQHPNHHHRPMKTRRKRLSAVANLGFQIAPMVDVVFVILIFFMVMAGSIRTEKFLNTSLPGDGSPTLPLDEIAIRIADDGQVYLNDDPLDSPDSKTLTELAGNLKQLRQSGVAASSDVVVTIYADEAARYERVVDTLDALSFAQISNVTFQAGAPG